MTDVTFWENGHWIGTRTADDGTVTLVSNLFYSQLHGQKAIIIIIIIIINLFYLA